MPYPTTPLSTEDPSWYKVGQKATDAPKHVEQVKDADGDRHEWVSDTALTLGAGIPTPPPISNLESIDPAAYLAANQGKILSDADIASVSTSGANLVITKKDGTTVQTALPITTLDGNDLAVKRTNSTANFAPTAAEVPTPILGDTAKVVLADGTIEFWRFGTTWTKDFSFSYVTAAAFDSVYGTIGSTSPSGTVNAVANWGYLADGTPLLTDRVYFAATAGNVNRTTTIANLKNLLAAPDEIVSVSGVTFPITFPVATLPGTPVFAPATPTSATAVYKIVTGINVAYAAWNGTQYISTPAPVAITLDGNDRHIVRTNSSNAVAPSAVEVPSPIAGDTAKIQLANKSIEYWSYNTAWVLDFTQLGLDGNDKHVLRANATVNTAPTALEVPTPIFGDTAKVSLTDGSIEYWTFGAVWARDFTSTSVAPSVTFGTAAPAAAPTNKKGDEHYVTSTGTSAGAIQSRWIYDSAAWINTATTVPDDIVDVNGATLPITFPTTTLPGAPVFVPATPTSTTAIYAIAGATGIQYAKWNGTQYISSPAPLTPNVRYGSVVPVVIAGTDKKNDTYIQTSDGTAAGTVIAEWVFDGTIWKNVTVAGGGHFRSGTGLTAPDGVADPSENVSRIGKTGFGITDPSTLQFAIESDGTTGIRQGAIANTTNVCTVSALLTSSKASVVVTQTVSDAILLFAAPNVPLMAGQIFTVINSDLSTNKISYLGYDIHPNQSLTFVHSGRMWQIEEVGINSDVQLETAVTVLPTSTTALNSFTVVPGGIQSSTTAWVEVPGTTTPPTTGGEYLVKYVVYASCTGGIPIPAVGNGFRIAVGSNVITGTVQVATPQVVTGRVIETSQTLITNVTAGQIDPYTKTVIVRTKPGEVIQLQMNSVIGAQIVYQSATQNSRLEYAKIVNSTPISYAATTQLAGSATPYTYLPLDNNLIVTGGAGVVQNIALPSASVYPGREISLQMPELNNYETNLISGGGNIEFPDYSFTGSGRLSSGSVASLTWQSDGIAWRLMSYVNRQFYSTTGYPVPTSNFITFLGAGGVVPAPGVAFQIPGNATSWLVTDGNYNQLIALPIGPTVTGRFSVYPNNSPGFDTIISTAGTNLPRNTTVPSGQGRSMHFEWSDGKWRWVPAPELLASALRGQRRGTFAAPLTGAITVAIDDEMLVVASGSTTTLPSPAAPSIDRKLTIKKPGIGVAAIVGSIDGVANLSLAGTSESIDLRSDGTTWMRV
jgi:hypothetical protein